MASSSHLQHQADWIAAYEAGESLRSIGKRYQLDHSIIRYWVKKQVAIRPREVDTERLAAIYALHQKGWSRKDIAKHFGVSSTAISDLLRRHYQVPLNTRRSLLTQYDDIIKFHYESGQSIKTISEELDLAQGTIRKALERQGVTRRSGHESTRTYWTDDTFFNEIDTEKSYDLGVFWAVATFSIFPNETRSICSFYFKLGDEPRVLTWMSRFTQDDSTRFLYPTSRKKSFEFRIYSPPWTLDFREWGFKRHLPTVPELDETAFWQGFWQYRLRCQKTNRTLALRFDTLTLAYQAIAWLEQQGIRAEELCLYQPNNGRKPQLSIRRLNVQSRLLVLFPFIASSIQAASAEWWEAIVPLMAWEGTIASELKEKDEIPL